MSGTLVLGAGLAGLSASYHIGHARCLLLERNSHEFGHLHVEYRDGFTWDEGPHVSFTKHEYVRQLFAESVNGEFDEYEVKTTNYFRGHWIDHPAQSSLYQVPEPLRSACLESFIKSRTTELKAPFPLNYAEWLEMTFGKIFAETFPAAYTRKYWTREARDLTTDWLGERVFQPTMADVTAGSKGPLGRKTHYITTVRYPRNGGFQGFARKISAGARIKFGAEVTRIDLLAKEVWTANGECYPYEYLVNTIPLPVFVQLCTEVPPRVKEAACQLSCSQLLLVNVSAAHPTLRGENWMYVYDEDKYSTRINCTERLTPGNAPVGYTGLQVEVYSSRFKPLQVSPAEVAKAVESELVEMGLIDPARLPAGQKTKAFTVQVPWANVIFDHNTRPALDVIWRWLETFGLRREEDDTHPLSSWGTLGTHEPGEVVMAGRYGQWKYFWSDDCILRSASWKCRPKC